MKQFHGGKVLERISKEDLVKKVGDLKVLPFVARKLIDTLGHENVSIDELSSLIEKDQTLAARVLKISNSALYGLRHEVTSLQQAIMMLGFKTVRSLVLSLSTKALYKKFGMTEKMLWDHSVGAAIAARLISADLGGGVNDIAFLGGLMHDLGKVFMNNESPDAFSEVMMNIYNEGTESIFAEQEIFGYSHEEVGAEVTAKWGFSPNLVVILGHHHLRGKRPESLDAQLNARAIACVHLANNMCKVIGIGYREPDKTIVLQNLPSVKFLRLEKNRLDEMLRQTGEIYEREIAIFQ